MEDSGLFEGISQEEIDERKLDCELASKENTHPEVFYQLAIDGDWYIRVLLAQNKSLDEKTSLFLVQNVKLALVIQTLSANSKYESVLLSVIDCHNSIYYIDLIIKNPNVTKPVLVAMLNKTISEQTKEVILAKLPPIFRVML
jgi:hypothetical protein